MYKTFGAFRTLLALSLLAVALCGCGEQIDVKRDAVDPESLKAMKHLPPGMPGGPAKPGALPGAPSGTGK